VIERPSLHALAVFLAVVEHGTMTAAAEEEGISQPAISAQIKVLERYYGTILLQRTGRGVVPTATGQNVADHAARILALVDELDRLVRDLKGLQSGRLVIGASSTVGEQFLPAHLGRFHAAYPHVELEVRIGNTGEITVAVVRRELDFAFVGSPPESDELIAEPVFADDVVAFVAPGDPLLRDAPIDPAALSGRQYVLRERGSATRDLALHCLAAAGCEPAHVIELGSNEAVKRAVEARHRGRALGRAPGGPPNRGLAVRPIVLAHPPPRPCAHPGRAGVSGTAATAGRGGVALSAGASFERSLG
jgi:DNA-binding transcriptional LysR family regulator